MSFTWVNGRQLGALQKGDLNVSYSYNSDGLRVSKTVNGVKTEYVWDGSSLIGQKTGNNVLVYLYAADGLAGFQYNGVNYYYLFNGQGDVVAILDASGNIVAKYTYDAWGKLLSVTDAAGTDKSADASFIGNINPIRYRSYYYDTETGLYYLQSRYYDPEVGRFVNADGCVSTGQGPIGNNMFSYCLNNPILFIDITGNICHANDYGYQGPLCPFIGDKCSIHKKTDCCFPAEKLNNLPNGGTIEGGGIGESYGGTGIRTDDITFVPPDEIKDLQRREDSLILGPLEFVISVLDYKYGTPKTGGIFLVASIFSGVNSFVDEINYRNLCEAIDKAARNGNGLVFYRTYVTDPRANAGNGFGYYTYVEWDGQFGSYPYAYNPFGS